MRLNHFNHDCECASPTIVMQVQDAITPVNSIAERLAWARERLGLNQKQLAALADVSQGTIGNIEAGLRKNPRELLAIAAAVQVNPMWLKEGKGPVDAFRPTSTDVADLTAALRWVGIEAFSVGPPDQGFELLDGVPQQYASGGHFLPTAKVTTMSGEVVHIMEIYADVPETTVTLLPGGNAKCVLIRLKKSESILQEKDDKEVAHGLSHTPEQTPSLTREKLMSGVEPKGEFWVELWDEAIGQELPKGTLTLWDADLAPEVGDFVLIRTEDGRPHVRVYGESLAHGWQGKPLHSDYEPIPGTGARVLAVFVSAKVRRSQLRR